MSDQAIDSALEQQLGRYKILLETARSFSTAMDLDSLVDEILDRSREVVDASGCTLLLPDESTGELIIYSTDQRISGLEEPLRVPAGRGISGWVYQNREPVNVANASEDPRHYQGIGEKIAFKANAMLCIPLMNGADCLGVMQALNPLNCEVFSEQQYEIFQAFGSLIVNALLRLEAENQKLERAQELQELQMAQEIQKSFLPPSRLRFPFGSLHTRYFPARTVSGDFYFAHEVRADRYLVGLADVSGKGLPAALTMARATATIKTLSHQATGDLGEWVSMLNQHVSLDLKAGRFIGLTFLLIDATRNSLQICAAGQYAPFRFINDEWRHEQVEPQLPLGILDDFQYKSSTVNLQPGEFWVLISDGITEARNECGEDYTDEVFLKSLPRHEVASATLKEAVKAWRKFVGNAPQHDDSSIILLDWRGLPPPAEFHINCSPETLCECRGWVERWAAHAGFTDLETGQIIMACDEAASNVFRHAYQGVPGPLHLSASLDDKRLVFQLSDHAGKVDPANIRGRNIEEVKPGGLGTVIIQSVFQTVTYESTEKGTTLTLAKYLSPEDATSPDE